MSFLPPPLDLDPNILDRESLGWIEELLEWLLEGSLVGVVLLPIDEEISFQSKLSLEKSRKSLLDKYSKANSNL